MFRDGDGLSIRNTTGDVHEKLSRAARFFGLSALPASGPAIPGRGLILNAMPRAGEITLITGASGSGKSTFLRGVLRAWSGRTLEIGTLLSDDSIVVDLFGADEIDQIVSRLARVGLGEAGVLGRRVGELSVGERFRLEVAAALWRADQCDDAILLVCDEFTSSLDEVTAWAVSSALARSIAAASHVAAVVSTWREEIQTILKPTKKVFCDFGVWEVS